MDSTQDVPPSDVLTELSEPGRQTSLLKRPSIDLISILIHRSKKGSQS
jgi:hypothetical protein